MSDPSEIKISAESIVKKLGNYYLREYGKCLPTCKMCLNSHGPCGTPCQGCERAKVWNDNFDSYLLILDQFVVYKRKASVAKENIKKDVEK